jgi:hypothetical protein
MTVRRLQEIFERAAQWPETAQAELAELAREIDAELGAASYRATREELRGLDRGLKAAREGRYATADQVDELFRKHRPK